MEPDNKQVEQESEDLLPDGMTLDQLRAEILEEHPTITIEELEALGF